MLLSDAIAGVHRLGLDTAPIIYFIEENPSYIDRADAIFRLIAEGRIEGIVSTLTLCELLVHPLQKGDNDLSERYRNLLMDSLHLHSIPVDVAVAERAADLRARYRLRTPDALQLATATTGGCEAFLTNDRQLTRVTDISVLVLEDLELP